jgi:hypothetical protein
VVNKFVFEKYLEIDKKSIPRVVIKEPVDATEFILTY